MTNKLHCSSASIKAWGWFIVLTLPLCAGAILLASHRVAAQLLMLLTGWLCWTFFEYYLHRFVMHDAKGRTDPAVHAEHHRHHRHPSELRVLGWHRVTFALVTPVLLVLSWHFNNWFTLLVGFHIGLASYAYTHWMLHRPLLARKMPRLYRHHLHHHCARPNTCYGVTVTWWDVLLGTGMAKERTFKRSILRFYFGCVPAAQEANGPV